MKVMEPFNLLGAQHFAALDVRIRVKGGGQVSQVRPAAFVCSFFPFVWKNKGFFYLSVL